MQCCIALISHGCQRYSMIPWGEVQSTSRRRSLSLVCEYHWRPKLRTLVKISAFRGSVLCAATASSPDPVSG